MAENPTLILKNCRLVNVYSGMIEDTDIAISGDRITGIDKIDELAEAAPGAEVIDCEGRYVTPGLIDAHMHVDTTFLWPGELARAIVPMGTTTLFVDPTNNAHTGGTAAIKALEQCFEGLPIRGFVCAPSYCPFNSELGTAATEMSSREIADLLATGAESIGETVWTRLEQEDREYVTIVQTCREAGLRVSGHGGEVPRGIEAAFDAYVSAGIQDDHCISRPTDILPRLRRGLHQFFVECTGRRGQLRPLVDEALRQNLPYRRMSICIDNNTSMDIVTNKFGYMDYLVRIALDAGVPPVEAYRMATLNPAEHHRRSGLIGSITPGRLADLLILDELDAFPPHKVIVGGKVVAEEGRLIVDIPAPVISDDYRNSVRIGSLRREQLTLKADNGSAERKVRVIKSHDGDAFNTELIASVAVTDGQIVADPSRDLLKIAVVERYGRFGDVGIGLVNGFGLRRGAVATSISVPFNNLVVAGADDRSIWTALQRISELQGGFVVADGDDVIAEVPLPVGGLMSTLPFEQFLAAVDHAEDAARGLGCTLENPFKTLVSTVHTTLPDLGLTDRGLIDTRVGKPVSLFVSNDVQTTL